MSASASSRCAPAARSIAAAIALALLPGLTGCPSSYGFVVRVTSAKTRPLKVVAMQPATQAPVDVAALPGARVSCSPCDAQPVMSDIDGAAALMFGTSYGSPPPTVVRVSAPGFFPAEFTLDEIPHDSSLGYGTFIVVLQPDPNAPAPPPPTPRP